jgi:hypothetical protein
MVVLNATDDITKAFGNKRCDMQKVINSQFTFGRILMLMPVRFHGENNTWTANSSFWVAEVAELM